MQSCCFARKTNCFLRRRRRGSVKRLKDAMGLFSRPTLSPTRLQKTSKNSTTLNITPRYISCKGQMLARQIGVGLGTDMTDVGLVVSTLEKSLRHVAW